MRICMGKLGDMVHREDTKPDRIGESVWSRRQ